MRIVADIPHPRMKITCFHHDLKYSIKFEKNLLEQIYKLRELSTAHDIKDVLAALNADQLARIESTLDQMAQIRSDVLQEVESSNDFDFPSII